MKWITILPAISILIAGLACERRPATQEGQSQFTVAFEKFELENGLDVIFHIDRSDPVVAVTLTSHVGSAREKTGKTGFAHLFEHLLFLESENLGKGGLDKLSSRVGGSGANGSTSRDRTNYYQTVPNDALEKMLWAEADKLGYFINTVTKPVLAKEKQVVKNEKRQGVDNRPYGHTSYVIDMNLYPEDHPYNWEVIGSLEDLQNATIEDVKEFFRKWYVPNNVTLVVAGDFDTREAKAWVEKYFGEIPAGEEIPETEKRAAILTETKMLYHEDNFARLPELTIAWPAAPQYHADSYPLELLAQLLSEGKKAPFYQVLVEDRKLTADVNMFNYTAEIAGQFTLRIRAFENIDLDQVQEAIEAAFEKFEREGITDRDLNRVKAGQETAFYNGLSSVLGKGFQLAQYNIFSGDPGFINQDVQNILAVSREDILRVYRQYIKDRNFVVTSFVPKGQVDLALNGARKASVVEEKIVQGAEEEFNLSESAAYERSPSSFDRTIEPTYGKNPEIKVPQVWEDKLRNGMRIYGIENNEVPLVRFIISLRGGLLLDDTDKIGVANLVAELMTKGTRNRTPEDLEEALQVLGTDIDISAGREEIRISGNTLARNYDATMALVGEILLEPRWDESEFELSKQRIISRIKQQQVNPNSIASNLYNRLIYGKGHIFSHNPLGSESSVESISIEDLKHYYDSSVSPSVASFLVVGAIAKESVIESLGEIDRRWEVKPIVFPDFSMPSRPVASKVYFRDIPNSKQSVIRFGYPALAATDPDYYPATVMNYILGGGSFASQLTQELREGKGYTYSIRSSFSGTKIPGPFTISSGVRTNVTYEAASLIKEILRKYADDFDQQDLETTKSFLLKSNARAFETHFAKLRMLENISAYQWPYDYVKQREVIVKEMTVERIKALARKYADADKMIYLFVGDAASQMHRLGQLGYGDPILINEEPATVTKK